MPTYPPHPERRPAVITGASSGIGAATARCLGAKGFPVILAARRTDRLHDLAAEIEAGGGEAAALPLDLTDDDSIDDFATRALDVFGGIDIVVSNAGEVMPISSLGSEPEAFARSVNLNLLGAHRLVNRLGPALVEQGHGDIAFVTSDVVVRPRTHMAPYVAAKTGLEGLCRVMQMELEGTGVRVGMIRPGPCSTEQGTTWTEEQILRVMPYWEQWGHLRHNGALLPHDIAEVVHHMISAPKGCHVALVELQPEAPVSPDRSVL